MATLYHMKITYDSTVEQKLPALMKTLFMEDRPALAVEEKLASNHHIHIQGYSNLKPCTIKEHLRLSLADHPAYKKGGRPFRMVNKPVNETGFQYMMKEEGWKEQTMYSQHFTDDELALLHSQSVDHVEDLKKGLRKHLHEVFTGASDSPEPLHKKMRLEAFRYYSKDEKMTPPNFQKLVLQALGTLPPVSEERETYAAERI